LIEAQVAVSSIDAEIEKTEIRIQNEVAVAYRKFLHGRKLVEAMNGALAQASTLFSAAQQAFVKKELGILDLENTRRTYADTEVSHLDAIFGYQQNWLRLEWAAGRDITF
jgi:outer membrane protein TolC